MYKPNTVFIVGAGASKELGFPLGAELRDNISALLVTERNHRAYGPLMKPKDEEREGYVPNVVYTCGALINRGEMIIPYAMSDTTSGIATVSVRDLIASMKRV